ncbi:MAG: 50S ribosomal protein L15 [Dehalococcoidia bacterium]|jgi:large subunit ribosomal protein L15|nr:MAG: 50S ribosomal protein L15 [Dehalococcoidia bacterium]
MTRQDELRPAPGAVKNRKRVGRGDASGHGSFSGRGQKGQKARSGGKMRPGFEGGQLPMIKRLPRKRGFTNIFRTEYQVVNIEELNVFEAESEVTPEALAGRRLVRSHRLPVKILAGGELEKPLSVTAHKFSAAAKSKIEAAGGKVAEVALANQGD